jgi:hypothetical protein
MMEPCPLEPEECGVNNIVNDEGNGNLNPAKNAVNGRELFVDEDEKGNTTSFSNVFPDSTVNASNKNTRSSMNATANPCNSSVLVPVLRIFGPVLRNGDDSAYHHCTQDNVSNAKNLDSTPSSAGDSSTNTSYSQQPQSGCLHIHGAYPYMLARPVVAGPDGSMHHGHYYHDSQSNSIDGDIFSPQMSDDSSRRSHVDWDSVQSVSRVLNEVHQRLEGSLRASMENTPNPLQQQQSNSLQQTSLPTKYIRSIRVVTGRGFYTYCSGPPAPFLRVEYYDPSWRWRVKLILEKGLELSSIYHPDPRVYDYEFGEDELEHCGNRNADDILPLKFRCYEAHIPYTMQVFKDYNLAGLKYVNVGDVRFRQPLPKGLRRRTKDDFLRKEETQRDNSVFFFGDNVGSELLWPTFQDEKEKSQWQQATLAFREEHWLKKQTSCDLEFDTTVENLLNIHDVMTALPSPLEERQKIHWRAVPSLREIWEQERKRMKILLSPENDFLSLEAMEDQEINSSDSDSADEESSLELPEPSIPQFTLDVKKNASVPGTRLAVKGVKQLFRTSDGLEDDFRRAMKDIVLRHDRFIDDVDQKIINDMNGGPKSSPSLDDGIDALASLGHQFTQNSAEDDDEIVFGSQLSERTPDSTSVEQSQSNKYNTTQLTQAEMTTMFTAMMTFYVRKKNLVRRASNER